MCLTLKQCSTAHDGEHPAERGDGEAVREALGMQRSKGGPHLWVSFQTAIFIGQYNKV